MQSGEYNWTVRVWRRCGLFVELLWAFVIYYSDARGQWPAAGVCVCVCVYVCDIKVDIVAVPIIGAVSSQRNVTHATQGVCVRLNATQASRAAQR